MTENRKFEESLFINDEVIAVNQQGDYLRQLINDSQK